MSEGEIKMTDLPQSNLKCECYEIPGYEVKTKGHSKNCPKFKDKIKNGEIKISW